MQIWKSPHYGQTRQPFLPNFIHKIDVGSNMVYMSSKIRNVGNSVDHALPKNELSNNFGICEPSFKIPFAYGRVFLQICKSAATFFLSMIICLFQADFQKISFHVSPSEAGKWSSSSLSNRQCSIWFSNALTSSKNIL